MSSLENGRARELAELASVEQDPHKLIALVTELNFLLENEQKYSQATRLAAGESKGFMTTPDDWFEFYRAALLETDWCKLPERIRVAESALHERQRVLSADHGGTPEERRAIADALTGLAVLRKEATEYQARQLPAQPALPELIWKDQKVSVTHVPRK